MTIRLGLVGDTMLGRKVAERLGDVAPEDLVSDGVRRVAAEADAVIANLECCISERGEAWPDPRKPFFFRAPPRAVATLRALGVRAVTLANNHALDFGRDALRDTLTHLAAADIAVVGAGEDVAAARRLAILDVAGTRVGLLGLTDHPADYAATPSASGVAYANLRAGVPDWVNEAIADADADVVVVTPHWGPNMTASPVRHVRRAAPALVVAGADLVAGHSAHVFHGVGTVTGDGGAAAPVCYDLGDFLDDYAVDPSLRNDLGLFWFVDLDRRVRRIEAVPIALDYCRTRLAEPEEHRWVTARLTDACRSLGTDVREEDGRLVVDVAA